MGIAGLHFLFGFVLVIASFILDNVDLLMRQNVPSISAFNAWVLLNGLETV